MRSALAEALRPILAAWERSFSDTRPMMVGICGPQGSGKSTMTQAIKEELASRGRVAVALSLDDYYLTYEEQLALAQANPANPLLQYRGNAGTHDVGLLLKTLAALRLGTESVAVPTYDKSLRGGRGDRSGFVDVKPPVHLVMIEGWMFGFESLPQAQVEPPTLLPVNEALRTYQPAYGLIDYFVQIDPIPAKSDAHPASVVYAWRLEAEESMRQKNGGNGLDAAQVRDFVDRFMPAYRLYLPHLKAPAGLLGWARIRLKENRTVESVTSS